MSRNREETEARILAAGLDVLAGDGFAGFGINAVARKAGADKKLIYRYFDGIDGLMTGMGDEIARQMSEALGPALQPPPQDYAEMALRLVRALLAFLQDNAAYRQIRVAELAASPAVTLAFRRSRGAALAGWVSEARAGLALPEGRDTGALNALLIAAVEGAAIFGLAGLDPEAPETPARLEAALTSLVMGAYRSA